MVKISRYRISDILFVSAHLFIQRQFRDILPMPLLFMSGNKLYHYQLFHSSTTLDIPLPTLTLVCAQHMSGFLYYQFPLFLLLYFIRSALLFSRRHPFIEILSNSLNSGKPLIPATPKKPYWRSYRLRVPHQCPPSLD